MPKISVGGMSCQHCVQSVTKALSAIPGVTGVNVDLGKSEAVFEGKVDMKLVEQAIARIGFAYGGEKK